MNNISLLCNHETISHTCKCIISISRFCCLIYNEILPCTRIKYSFKLKLSRSSIIIPTLVKCIICKHALSRIILGHLVLIENLIFPTWLILPMNSDKGVLMVVAFPNAENYTIGNKINEFTAIIFCWTNIILPCSALSLSLSLSKFMRIPKA